MALTKEYPVGIYTFDKIRLSDLFYVDKTRYVYNITHKFNYVFLSRPRRFGKSLLVDTLQCYFEAKKELFKGLALDALEREWIKYPVFRFDMSTIKAVDASGVRDRLNSMLHDYENIYGRVEVEKSFGDRLIGLIKRAYAQSGQKVVLLIDEYDSALLKVMHNKAVFDELREILRDFYAPIKICDAMLRFGFITGITKFSQLSIFSEINNLMDISMESDYSGICGISKEELLSQCKPDIQSMADSMGCSYDEAVNKLTENYDGYHFSFKSEDMFNPFSLINAFATKRIGQYWYSTGTPTFLFEQMKKWYMDIRDVDGQVVDEGSFNISPETADSALPVLYQSGYLTIKDYEDEMQQYTLGFPNKEVKNGFLRSFLPTVSNIAWPKSNQTIVAITRALNADDIDTALTHLKAYISAIPYYYENKTEPAFQTIMYLILSLLGQYIKVEVNNAVGRTDAVLETANTIYIIEYKVDKSANEALKQIEDKHYADPYAADKRRILKVGVNFSTESRTIENWKTCPKASNFAPSNKKHKIII